MEDCSLQEDILSEIVKKFVDKKNVQTVFLWPDRCSPLDEIRRPPHAAAADVASRMWEVSLMRYLHESTDEVFL